MVMAGAVHEDPEEHMCLLWTGQQTASAEDKQTLLARGEKMTVVKQWAENGAQRQSPGLVKKVTTCTAIESKTAT